LSSSFNAASAGAGDAVPRVAMFASVFYTGGHVDSYAGGLSELCHKCVIYGKCQDPS